MRTKLYAVLFVVLTLLALRPVAFGSGVASGDLRPSITFTTGQITAPNGSATVLVAANRQRKRITIYNTGGAQVFVGNSAVTATTGHQITNPSGTAPVCVVILETTSILYVFGNAGTSVVTYIEESYS